MRAAGIYDPDDILMFATASDIAALKKVGDYKGDKYWNNREWFIK